MSLATTRSLTATTSAETPAEAVRPAVMPILFSLSFSHLVNDTMQSVLPAIYPLLKVSFSLSFAQIGLITLVNQVTASLLQPVVGYYTDLRPKPFAMAAGMGFMLVGLGLMALAGNFALVLLAAGCIGLGSSIFHPEASRVVHLAAGGRHGFAQSLFQVGGNLGTSLGPLLAALILVPGERSRVLWFGLLALVGVVVLAWVGAWFRENLGRMKKRGQAERGGHGLSRGHVVRSIAILVALVFSKYFYIAGMVSFYTFYLMEKFSVSVPHAQLFLFLFLFAVAAGTLIGGQLGDRFGRKRVIWFSILGAAPFTLLLPYINLPGVAVLTVLIGLSLASAFPAIVVFAQELVPGNVGMIAGLFFGLAFGTAGIGSAVLGKLADMTSIGFVFQVCSFLPLLGLLAAGLPELEPKKQGI